MPPSTTTNQPRPRARVESYAEPPPGFARRFLRRIFSPWVVIPIAFLTTLAVGVFGYYYTVYSDRIDGLLRGEVFTRSAGIYAVPKDLRAGAAMSADDVVARLKRADYVEKTQQADTSRGRYTLSGSTLEIEPSQNGKVDGERRFSRLRIQFARGGKSIAAITDPDTNKRLDSAPLEPELISSVTGPSREKRKVIGFQDLPKHLVEAITVTEDRTFFKHHGVNLRGILRALVRRYDADPKSPIARQGGSSITQQLVKNLLLSPEPTIRRKIAEAYMSIILETRLSKEDIFALYCNEAYLGQRAGFSINGFGEAADAYFNKDITQLTLPESAFLAGIIRSPNRYNPYRHPDVAVQRRNQVLQSMADAGVIPPATAQQAQATELKTAPVKGRIDASEAPYFVDYVQNQLSDYLADVSAAERLRIYTTIDMDLQRAAYNAVTKQLAQLDKIYAKRKNAGGLQAALVAMHARTGEIIAMVGGRDYERSQFNRATDAVRQPGSVFKPFVYATALNTAFDPVPRVITPATTYLDEPKTFTFDNQQYAPGNFGDQYSHGPVTVRDALVKSLNVVTVEMAMEVTMGRVMNLAAKAGLPRPQKPYPAMALGSHEATPLQMASAYTAFAAEGTRTTPIAINRITTGEGATVIAPTGQRNEVMRPEVAFIMTSFMKEVVERGTAARLRARGFRYNVAGKTGSSRDGWFAGYTPNIVCAVYVGFDDGAQLGLTGSESALPIWADFMSAALAAHPEWGGDWQAPPGVQQADIDIRTGELASADNPYKRTELFVNGTVPTVASDAPMDETYAEGEEPGGNGDESVMPPTLPPLPPGGARTLPMPDGLPPAVAPGPGTRSRTPTLEGRGVLQPDGSTRLTVTLDIDPTTNLIAAPTCPVIRTKSFPVGQEPREYCGPEYHSGRVLPRPTTRPRVVTPNFP